MNNHYAFIGGKRGTWRVISTQGIVGPSLPLAEKLDVVNGMGAELPSGSSWILRGFTSNLRYAQRNEVSQLIAIQPGLNRPEASCAALIPIKKNSHWWDMPQDERRAIFEEQSNHTAIGLAYLPAIARRLHHSRDLGEPFDFLTWFEFAPEHTVAFNELLVRLRASKEWRYVEHEVEIRLERDVT